MASKLRYDHNTTDYHQSVLLSLAVKEVPSRIVISFHSVGAAFRGLMAVRCLFPKWQQRSDSIVGRHFQNKLRGAEADIDNRYEAWLDQCLIKGLAEWRRSIV